MHVSGTSQQFFRVGPYCVDCVRCMAHHLMSVWSPGWLWYSMLLCSAGSLPTLVGCIIAFKLSLSNPLMLYVAAAGEGTFFVPCVVLLLV